jgi:hypothetical protein
MRLDIQLEPLGEEADSALAEWVAASALKVGQDGRIEVVPDRCMDILAELRSRCYDRGLIVNGKFFGTED